MTNVLLVFNRKSYCDGAQEAKMTELALWVKESDKVISF